MYFHEDWLIKQIENMAKAIAIFIFNRDSIKYEIGEESSLSREDILYNQLHQMISNREFCKAENILCESIDSTDPRDLELAVDFYQTLNSFSNEELEKCNFTREKINEGIKALAKTFGISDSLLY